ncbi:MAG: efflux RND transporter permease subunit [Myxococcota bacterium]
MKTSPNRFLNSLIVLAAQNPRLTLIIVALLALAGWQAIQRAPLDAIPDLSEPQVIILSEWAGQSPDLIEDQLSYPLSSAMLAAPKVKSVRAQSSFGLSFVYVIFEEGTDIYWARSRTQELLSTVRPRLPEAANIQLGPDASGVGWVMMYALVDTSGQVGLGELRSLQDWRVQTALSSVSGVAEVAAFGGQVERYEISVNPSQLRAYDLTIGQLKTALSEANQSTGGGVIEQAGHEFMIRGQGYFESLADIQNVPLRIQPDGQVLTVGMVADVQVGPSERRGIAEWNGLGETVGGIVIMRHGENAQQVCANVRAEMARIQTSLPQGVEIELAYDRSEFIGESVDTLQRSLIEELVVVGLIMVVFFGRFRSAVVALVALPVAVLLSFLPIYAHGFTLNIMSLGGVAVAIGAMVDAVIVMLDNIHKKQEEGQTTLSDLIEAMQEVGPSVFVSLLILSVSFLPLLFLEGMEGRLFRPLALTKTYAMLAGALVAVVLIPALSVLLLKNTRHLSDGFSERINGVLEKLYAPIARRCAQKPWEPIILACIGMGLTVTIAGRIDTEFMPPLNEGSILYMPSAPPGISSTAATRILQNMDTAIKAVPEVKHVLGKMGRANTATDPAPLGMAETTIVLKPKSEWRAGMDWDGIIQELDQKLQIPGMPNLWWMPIQTRVEMLSTGIRSPLAIQVFATSPETLQDSALTIEAALKSVSGSRSVFAERTYGGNYLDIDIDRDRAAQWGVRSKHLMDSVQTAIAGTNVGTFWDGRARHAVQLRYARDFRSDQSALGNVWVQSLRGPVPLSEVADVVHREGPSVIRTENAQLQAYVFVDLNERSVQDYVQDANAILEGLQLAEGVNWKWAGQFQHIERVVQRMEIIVPICLIIVLLLVYWNTGSVIEMAMVMLALPFSLIGAVWLMWALDFQWSVASLVGLIALAGLDAETGMVMLLYLKIAIKRWTQDGRLQTRADLDSAIVEGAAHRIRPKLMTVLTSMVGLLPLLWSTGPGADMMKRVAAPMVGGLASSFLLELCVYPALFAMWSHRQLISKEKIQ